MSEQFERSVCPHDCPSVCALDIEVLDENRIGRVYGAKDHSYTDGVICAKVSRYAERANHPDRLTEPLILTGSKGGTKENYRTASWEEVLDLVASRLQQSIDEHGAESIWPYHYAGTMGLVQRDGLDRFRHELGTSRMHATFCTSLPDAGYIVGTGVKRGADSRLMAESDLIVVWGGNPVNTQVNVMNYISKARRNRGAKLIVIDPYKTRTAVKADQHLMLKPGTDAALACAVMHVLFRDSLIDQAYLDQYTDCDQGLQDHLAERSPEWAAPITGLSAEEIEAFAKVYGYTKKSFLRLGYGFARCRNGAVSMHAALCLPAVTGAWRYEGGGALYANAQLYSIDRSLIEGLDIPNISTRTMDQSRIGEVLCGNEADLQGGPPVSVLFIQNTNPAVVAPDTNRVLKGLMRSDLFTVVHEQFYTDTAKYADVILPATMFTEHDDVYQAGGHTHLQIGNKLVDSPGQCKSNHWVLQQLAKRLGLLHPGFELDEKTLIEKTLELSSLPDVATLTATGGHDCALEFESTNFLDGFETADKRFHFYPKWATVGPHSDGMPALPDHWEVYDAASATYPLRLVAAPARQFLNTSFTETPTSRKMEKEPHAKMHPEDMQTFGITHQHWVTLGNERGEVTVKAVQFDGLQRGTVVVESIWPNGNFGDGLGINALISSEPGKPNGGAVFHDTAVWAKPGKAGGGEPLR